MSLVPPSAPENSGIQSATVDVPTASVRSLDTIPFTLVGGVPGQVLCPLAALVELLAGTSAFGGGGAVTVNVGAAISLNPNVSPGATVDQVSYRLAASVIAFNVSAAVGLPITLNATAPLNQGPILSSQLNAAGTDYASGDTGTVTADSADAEYAVVSVSNSFPISAVNQGTKTFTLTGDASAFQAGNTLHVYGSTGNDGNYTIVSATFAAGSTAVVVVEAIPNATGDGHAGDSTLAPVGAITAYAMTNPGSAYTVANGDATATGGAQPGVGAGLTIDVLTVTQGNGSLRVTVLYHVVG